MVAITETWLKGNESDKRVIGNLVPDGYVIAHIPRIVCRGGGVAIIHKSGITHELSNPFNASSFEAICCNLQFPGTSIPLKVAVIYRLHPTAENKLTTTSFITEFTEYLSTISLLPGNLLIVGDFNFHLERPTDHDTICL